MPSKGELPGKHKVSHSYSNNLHVVTEIRFIIQLKEELEAKQFSGASTDKLIIDGGAAVPDDAAIVAGLMKHVVDTFGQQWSAEQEKQRGIANRQNADVPLLTFSPVTFRRHSVQFSQ